MHHRRRVCEAVIHVMEKRKGESLFVVEAPDETERREKAVDLKVRGASSEFVMEHTRVESFPHQIADDIAFAKCLGVLETELSGELPTPGHYMLVLPAGVLEKTADRDGIRNQLAAWVRRNAANLHPDSLRRPPSHCVRAGLPGIPFDVTLYRLPGMDGKFRIARSSPEDLEEKRKARIQSALDSKCPKLHASRANRSISVLVLESNDLALANHVFIAQTLAGELVDGRDEIPDEIYLVETEMDEWVVWVLKEGPHVFPAICDSGPHYIGSQAE